MLLFYKKNKFKKYNKNKSINYKNKYLNSKKKILSTFDDNIYNIGLKINSRQFYFFYKLVNNLIINGKKDKAINILYNVVLSLYSNYKNKDPFFVIDRAIRRSILVVKIKKKRIAGRVHHVPLFLKRVNQINFSLKSFVDSIRLRSERTMILKLVTEIVAINSKDYSAVVWRKKKLLYSQAIANKFYVKYL